MKWLGPGNLGHGENAVKPGGDIPKDMDPSRMAKFIKDGKIGDVVDVLKPDEDTDQILNDLSADNDNLAAENKKLKAEIVGMRESVEPLKERLKAVTQLKKMKDMIDSINGILGEI